MRQGFVEAMSSNLWSIRLEILLVDPKPIGIQLIKHAFSGKVRQGISEPMGSNQGCSHLKTLLVSQKPTGIELSGKRTSLDDRRKDIRNGTSIEVDTLLGHPWLYWVARGSIRWSVSHTNRVLGTLVSWGREEGHVMRRFRINCVRDAKFIRHRHRVLRLLKGLYRKNLSACPSLEPIEIQCDSSSTKYDISS